MSNREPVIAVSSPAIPCQLLSDESYVTASHFAGLLLHHPAMESPVPYRQYGHVVLVEPNPVCVTVSRCP